MTTTKTTTKNIEISLTNFTDFLLRVGLPKLKQAETIWERYRSDYEHHKDYYKQFREAVCAIHRKGRPIYEIDQLLSVIPDLRGKRANYEQIIRGYKRFWATFFQEMEYSWTTPPKAQWKYRRLIVRVNPELAFSNGEETHLIKLYLKKDPPGKEQVRLILHLMQIALRPKIEKPVISLLDVRRARLFEATSFDPRLTALLDGEGAAFLQMYQSIEEMAANRELPMDPDY